MNKKPNLQNIPLRTKLGKELRDAFVQPLPDVDFSELERRVLEQLEKEEKKA